MRRVRVPPTEQVIEFNDNAGHPHKHLKRTWWDKDNKRNTQQTPLPDCPSCREIDDE